MFPTITKTSKSRVQKYNTGELLQENASAENGGRVKEGTEGNFQGGGETLRKLRTR